MSKKKGYKFSQNTPVKNAKEVAGAHEKAVRIQQGSNGMPDKKVSKE